MEINFLFILISIVCAALVGYLILLDNRNLRMLRMRVKKMYASPMFEEMVPLLKNAQKRPIEKLQIDKTGVVFRFLEPTGSESRFLVRDYGYRYLTPEKQEALLILLEEFLPKITDTHRYTLRKRKTHLVSRQSEIHYQYVMLNSYKASLIRAPYYEHSLQQLWQ